jgi:lipid A ethanolaminephosphotransferase
MYDDPCFFERPQACLVPYTTCDDSAPVTEFVAALRTWWQHGIPCPHELTLALVASLAWLVLDNGHFWRLTAAAMSRPTLDATLFFGSLFVVTLLLQSLLLAMMPTQFSLRAAASLLFVVGAASSYFCSAYGVVMNDDMLRNLIETDIAEVRGIVNADLLAHILVLGVLPATLVWRVRLPPPRPRAWRKRSAFVIAALALIAASLFASAANYAVFFGQYKPVRYSLNPIAPLVSLAALLAARESPAGPLTDPGEGAVRVVPPQRKPLVLVLVIGETARAANFQLGGYERPTNPELSRLPDLFYFANATACGTSTAVSVPCMFSHLPRKDFLIEHAPEQLNLLDTLAGAGFDVQWHDNNAGCKGVCERVSFDAYSAHPQSDLCTAGACLDGVTVTGLRARLERIDRDTVMVFHQIGSHGPAYSERYPSEFEPFKPACHTRDLQRCTHEEVVNAYDNTIAYTDRVLAGQIAALREASDRLDALLIYVSDHGESLGEGGLYLHGLPYPFAPDTQTHVPLLMWPSPGYVRRVGLSPNCVRSHTAFAVSHDNLYHTALGAAGVRNARYDPHLDLLFACRELTGAGLGHE